MNIIFQIDGGIGKSIAATAVCKAIKMQYPEDQLIVISGYPEVFTCNPYKDRALHYNNLPYFYQDFVQGREVRTFLHNPYLETDFINLKGHLIEVWCRMLGIAYNGEQPELFSTDREQNFYANQFVAQNIIRSGKPILLLQTNGGGREQPNKYSWARDMPIGAAQHIVNLFSEQYQVIHIRRNDQLPLQNTTPVHADFRALFVLIAMSHKRLFIDSFAQHAAAALGKPSVVCWVGNTPTQFGYDMHTNIIANPPTVKPELKSAVFTKYNIGGDLTEFPYNNESEIFDLQKIVDALTDAPDTIAPAITLQTSNLIETIIPETEEIPETIS